MSFHLPPVALTVKSNPCSPVLINSTLKIKVFMATNYNSNKCWYKTTQADFFTRWCWWSDKRFRVRIPIRNARASNLHLRKTCSSGYRDLFFIIHKHNCCVPFMGAMIQQHKHEEKFAQQWTVMVLQQKWQSDRLLFSDYIGTLQNLDELFTIPCLQGTELLRDFLKINT